MHDARFAVKGHIQELQTFTALPLRPLPPLKFFPHAPLILPPLLTRRPSFDGLFHRDPLWKVYSSIRTPTTSSQNISHSAQLEATIHTKSLTGRIPPHLPISQCTAVLRWSLNAAGSHRRPSPCANSGEVDARSVISIGQYSFVAHLGDIQDRNSPGVTRLEQTEKNSLLVSGRHLFNLIDKAHVSPILSIYVFLQPARYTRQWSIVQCAHGHVCSSRKLGRGVMKWRINMRI